MDLLEKQIYLRYQKLICEKDRPDLGARSGLFYSQSITLSEIIGRYDAFCF
jgi:hypothetical protein